MYLTHTFYKCCTETSYDSKGHLYKTEQKKVIITFFYFVELKMARFKELQNISIVKLGNAAAR